MTRCDYHVHTTFSDGVSTPQECIEAAIALHMEEIGLSDHSDSPQDTNHAWSMPKKRYAEYVAEIRRLQEKYRGKIRVLCGMEQDIDSPPPPEGLDYLIGSVHYLNFPDHFVPVDEAADLLKESVRRDFGGDPYALCEAYYRKVAQVGKTGCSIIGHFDLVSKFSEVSPFFDTDHPRYRKAQQEALLALLPLNIPFEINTGAISRGYRTTPYPGPFPRSFIREHGGRMLLSSDSHRADTIMYRFDLWESLLTQG